MIRIGLRTGLHTGLVLEDILVDLRSSHRRIGRTVRTGCIRIDQTW